MTLLFEACGLLLVMLGIALIAWLAAGGLLLPGPCTVRVLIPAEGDGEGLEQTVKGFLWLRKAGLWKGTVVIENCGLACTGLLVARALARQDGVEFT